VVEAELAPYRQVEDLSVVLTGPDVELAPNDALSLGLALHELATNASKYGALSVATGGSRSLGDGGRWHRMPALERVRRAAGGRHARAGFGTDLIEKIVAHELGHDVDLDFAVTGALHAVRAGARARVFHIRANALRETARLLRQRGWFAEEQRLCHGRHHAGLAEGLGDQPCRLDLGARQQPFGIGGDEDHRHIDQRLNIVHRIDARTAVGQLDIGQHEARAAGGDGLHRLAARGGGGADTVALRLTISSSCIAISGSSSMIITSAAVSRAISASALATSVRTSSGAVPRISAACSVVKSSTVVSSSA
jgi:hypothetical protein